MGPAKPNTNSPEKDGKTWEAYVNRLLCIHYDRKGYTYQPVPDQTHGDNGLEGWVDETGDAFQAHSGVNCDTTKKLTATQKTKITDDLNKLDRYKEFWGPIFAQRGVILKRWYLVVPHTANKAVLDHATKRAKILRDKGLAFICENFKTYVVTPNEYPEARASCREPELAKRLIRLRDATEEDIDQHDASAPLFITTLERKLRTLLPGVSESDLKLHRQRYIRSHLRRENYMADLEDRFPSHREELDEYLAVKAEEIKTNEVMDSDAPKIRLRRVREEVKAGISTTADFTNEVQRIALTEGTIAYWLGECSLDFSE